MNLLRYFDLNHRSARSSKRQHFLKEVSPNHPVHQKRFFWFNARHQESEQEEIKSMPLAEQILMYLGVVLGVCFRSLLSADAVPINFGLAAMIAFAIVPVAFEKLSIKPDAPLLFRFGLVVQHGMFWDMVLRAASGSLGV
ncbi:MAG: hypothetical protein Kow00121_30240 [Elainellaceae cyanobacterium]